MPYTREQLCEIVHQLLDQLPKYNKKTSEYGKKIPRNGIYFWYEDGEIRNVGGLHVTRVGTHREQCRLHTRIREHYSQNHAGSSFRLHVGGALILRNGDTNSEIKDWYKKRESPKFDELEQKYKNQITQEIEKWFYRTLKVDSKNKRSKLEEKFIALFSHCKHCQPSSDWLGNYSYKLGIRCSGLWNVDYVCSENELSESDLGRLKQLVCETLRFNETNCM